jgi:DUF1680 family protein
MAMIHAFCCLVPLAVSSAAGHAGAQVFVEPLGELRERIHMVHNRLLSGDVPRFTDEFVLADVTLAPDYPRRFTEYSGDLSGRYIGAMALLPPAQGPDIDRLVAEAIGHQRSDGRFGNEALVFDPGQITGDHMALLWGNGRLLVGLMEFYAVQPEPRTLDAARRLGDFLVGVQAACANEDVTKRVQDLGAAGMICFSQLVEGLVLLANATEDTRYLDAAERILPWLPQERGQQHSHGYLTTLRGVLLLFEATRKPDYLALVERLYGDLVRSSDLQVYGGVQEYFGGKGNRDEGCSEGDFIRLSLQLWRLTGNLEYLERAEHCLLNQFYANQFSTGDFGHHAYSPRGVVPVEGVGRAWWCCTMHGLRTFRDVLDAVVTERGEALGINLFQEIRWSDGERTLVFQRAPSGGGGFQIVVEKAPVGGVRFALRRPLWAKRVMLTLNGTAIDAEEQDGYLNLPRAFRENERIAVEFECVTRLVTRGGRVLTPAELTDSPTEAALVYGPWVLGVDEAHDPLFFGEPWDGNQVLLEASLKADGPDGRSWVASGAHFPTQYIHEGFPGEHGVILRPFSERSTHEPAAFAVFLAYRRAG